MRKLIVLMPLVLVLVSCASPGRCYLVQVDLRNGKQYLGSALEEAARQGKFDPKTVDGLKAFDPVTIAAIANGMSIMGGKYTILGFEWGDYTDKNEPEVFTKEEIEKISSAVYDEIVKREVVNSVVEGDR